MEEILKDVKNRFTLFPISHPKIYEFFQLHESGFWTSEEIDLKTDITDWDEKLNDNERYFIKNILAFFAASDGIVNENLVLNFYNDIQIPEARAYYTIQMLMETIHSQTYSILIDTFIKNENEKTTLFDAVINIPVINKKAKWALKWIGSKKEEVDNVLEKYIKTKDITDLENLANVLIKHKEDDFKNQTFIKQLLAFIIVEGLFFSGSFCAIFWLKNRGLMPGLCFSNELISRDEALHTKVGIHMYSLVKNRMSQEYVHSIFREAVDIEKEFITQALPVSLIGMNSEKMSLYIEYVADRLLYELGYNRLFGVKNCPFVFMELLSFSGENSKVNFFEKRNADYQKSGIGKSKEDMNIQFEDDF